MTKEQALVDCRGFGLADGVLSLWVFKKRPTGGFTANSIDVTDGVAAELKKIIAATLQTRTEVDDYSPLVQRNEVSCLHVGTDETSFGGLKALVDAPPEEHRIEGQRAFQNIAGYLVRVRAGARVLYCVRQVTDAWKTRKARTVVNVVLRANRLELVEDRSFTIAKNLDFVVLDNDILIIDKRAFETLLSYKIEYDNSFAALQVDPAFSGCFTTMAPLINHVGTNTMHLRRMAVIRQKANYANPDYMQRLRDVNAQEGWNIAFDAAGRIVATEETMRAIMQVLLDHRLHSKLSLTTFDVPSASAL
jgi:Domain of unknown function (DUF4868)